MIDALTRRGVGAAAREHRDAWLVALGVGTAVIVLGNVLWDSPFPVAIGVSLWMGYFGWSVRDTNVSSDSKGDSIYYLGLLFTFVALVAALVDTQWDSTGPSTVGIIRNFGIALVTTIVGIAGRVWFVMSEESPGDLENAIRSDLEDAVYEMKRSVDRSRDFLDLLADSLEESSKGMRAAVAKVAATGELAARTGAALEKQGATLAKAAESTAVRMRAFHDTVESGTKAARHLQSALAGIGAEAASLEKQLAAAGGGVRDFRSALAGGKRAVESTQDSIQKAGADARSIAADTTTLRRQVSGLHQRAERTRAVIDGVGGDVRSAGKGVQETLADAKAEALEAKRGAQGLSLHASEVEAVLSNVQESAAVAREGIAELAATTTSLAEDATAQGLRVSVRKVMQRSVRLQEDLGAAATDARHLRSALKGDDPAGLLPSARRISGAFDEMRRGLRGVVDSVGGQLAEIEPHVRRVGRNAQRLTDQIEAAQNAVAAVHDSAVGAREALANLAGRARSVDVSRGDVGGSAPPADKNSAHGRAGMLSRLRHLLSVGRKSRRHPDAW